ncbi:15-hydroxyprostaglandin dehydrogenase [NAD(+)]-like isoform X2 [Portunus trituberculatus]|uniref:15-hydroxyprostaglandin dehydrogenase [NAD(+)]-like isoform X2 n=1 Tax=Portunus trituberculatus TaxID=210409 RepID=UPI001E1D0D31|nr:15-hydroxyprostaglandin dehydrogenase [NAD(+)]-like isoform X2 [Portunus trituberculatus]
MSAQLAIYSRGGNQHHRRQSPLYRATAHRPQLLFDRGGKRKPTRHSRILPTTERPSHSSPLKMGSCLGSQSKEQTQPESDRTTGGKSMEIKGSVVIITGAARGLGRAFAEALLDHGAKICVADIDSEQGQATVTELQAKHGEDNVIFVSCNVTSDDDFKTAAYVKAQWCYQQGGCMRGTLLALERMGTNKGGSGGVVVNISSIVGLKANPFGPVYSASKHAIVGLVRSLGHDFHLKISGVKVQALCPSLVKTELLVNSMKKAFSPEVVQALSKFASGLKDLTAETVANGLVKLLEEGRNGGCLVVEAEKDPYYVEAPVPS